ncbi:MAG TPA: hypothetical protein VNK26_06745, partial [Pyrinomonadaceae bacterium]|nr:hypothetical protein [Pyrinomonadaceae bacterium]
MAKTSVNKIRLSERINAFVNNEAALRGIAESWTRRAKNIFNEASRLTLERITIPLNRLPRRLDGLRIVHLSDI